MAREKGIFHISANYEPLKAAPFDARSLVQTKADLLAADTWVVNGIAWVYQGMLVAVAKDENPDNNGVYMLIADDYTLEESWRKYADARDVKALEEKIENIEISAEGSVTVEVDEMIDLPKIGDSNTTYFVKENSSIQRWNEETQSYSAYGGSGVSPDLNIQLIYGGSANGTN